MVTGQEHEKSQTSITSVPQPPSYQNRQKCSIPLEIIRDPAPIWLGAYSKDTIPNFARNLSKKILFVDNAVDCIRYITLPFISIYPLTVIVSHDYVTNGKLIADLCNLQQIRIIYTILDSTREESRDWFFDERKMEAIFNDPLTVLSNLIRVQMKTCNCFGGKLYNIQHTCEENSVSLTKAGDNDRKSARSNEQSPVIERRTYIHPVLKQ